MATKKPELKSEKIRFPYQPHEKQKLVSEAIEQGARVVLYVAGIRGGKTLWMICEVFKHIYSRKCKPPLVWIVSPTYPMSMVPERIFAEIGYKCGLIVKEVKSQRAYIMRPAKGSTEFVRVEFKSAEDPDRLRGASIALAFIDEAAMCKPETFSILAGRVLDSKGIILIATTPRGKNWLYEDVFKKSLKDPSYVVIQAKTSDNPYLDQNEVADLYSRYASKSDTLARQEMGGEFCDFEGSVFNHFRVSDHVIGFREVPDGARVVAGADFGYNDPFAFVWLAQIDGLWYCVDEYYKSKTLIKDHASYIKNHPLFGRLKRIWADPSGLQQRKEFVALGIKMMPARRPPNLKALGWPEGRARVINQLFAKRVKSPWSPISETHFLPGLVFSDRVKAGVAEVLGLTYDRYSEVQQDSNGSLMIRVTDKEGKAIERNASEKIIDKDNHFVDALGYALFSEVRPYGNTQPHFFDADKGKIVTERDRLQTAEDIANEFIEARVEEISKASKASGNDSFDTLRIYDL